MLEQFPQQKRYIHIYSYRYIYIFIYISYIYINREATWPTFWKIWPIKWKVNPTKPGSVGVSFHLNMTFPPLNLCFPTELLLLTSPEAGSPRVGSNQHLNNGNKTWVGSWWNPFHGAFNQSLIYIYINNRVVKHPIYSQQLYNQGFGLLLT